MRKNRTLSWATGALILASLCGFVFAQRQLPPSASNLVCPTQSLEILATHPHDKQAFTQGLFFDDGFLYESTGQYGHSTLRQVELKTGKVLKQMRLPRRFFAEGTELVGDRIYQLTWREGRCFVYDKKTFQLLEELPYQGEGWGLAFDGKHLILSDGSATLYFLEPKTFRTVQKINVTDQDLKSKRRQPITKLNELEYIQGEIWANVWQTNEIVRIDPATGNVVGRIDGSVFVPKEFARELTTMPPQSRDHVLNGIAFDKATNRLYITGKNWPVMYEVQWNGKQK